MGFNTILIFLPDPLCLKRKENPLLQTNRNPLVLPDSENNDLLNKKHLLKYVMLYVFHHPDSYTPHQYHIYRDCIYQRNDEFHNQLLSFCYDIENMYVTLLLCKNSHREYMPVPYHQVSIS